MDKCQKKSNGTTSMTLDFDLIYFLKEELVKWSVKEKKQLWIDDAMGKSTDFPFVMKWWFDAFERAAWQS